MAAVSSIIFIITVFEFSLVQTEEASDESSLLPDEILEACTEPPMNLNETGGCYIDSSVENYPSKCFGVTESNVRNCQDNFWGKMRTAQVGSTPILREDLFSRSRQGMICYSPSFRFGPLIYGMHFDVEVIDVSVSSLPKHRKSMMCLFPHGVRDNDLLQGMKCCTGETEDLNQADYLVQVSAGEVPADMTTEVEEIYLNATNIALTNLTNAKKGYFKNETEVIEIFNTTEVSESNKKIHYFILLTTLVLARTVVLL